MVSRIWNISKCLANSNSSGTCRSLGYFYNTPAVTEDYAEVSITAKIKNTQSEDVNIELKTLIIDPEGKMVAMKKTASQKIIGQGELEISQQLNFTNPELWGLESPKLYQAISEVYQGGKLVDSYDTPFGIRYFNFDPVKGFF